ncbi:MFS transporter [Patescibacteria group bacterium]|nr:MFS transporter [Patescibacteria group bacterium]MBU1016458.1 MFS transporter [Patescibacteria group bacterium]MBU1684956.1 MFS transporter [Patescibacteria group bacterium]MBU1939016.1 MFS transporter [Patescibacteria group bacterium]
MVSFARECMEPLVFFLVTSTLCYNLGMQNEERKLQKNVFMLGLTSFFTDLSSEMIFPVLPIFLTSVLGANMAVIGLIEGVAESAATILKLVSGWISDKFGKKKPLIVMGYSFSAVTKPLLALTTHWWQVLVIRIADRVGKGIRTAPRDSLIAASVPQKKMGAKFGLHRAMDTAGAVVGTLVSFLILQRYLGDAFKIIFLLSAIPGVIAVSVLVFGVKDAPKKTESGKLSFNFSACDPALKRFLWAIAFFNLANFSYAFFILRANDIGLAVYLIPLVYLVYNIVYAALSIPIGRLSDRIGRKMILVAGILLFGLTSLGFGFVANTLTIWGLFALYGLFMAVTDGVSRAYVSDLTATNKRGLALGTYHAIVGITVLPANFIGGVLWHSINVQAPFIYAAVLSAVSALLLIFYVKGAR